MKHFTSPMKKIREVMSDDNKKEELDRTSNLIQEDEETKNEVINFFSPMYLASILVREGVNQNEEVMKKYGQLQRSYDFVLK